ncbi:MAG: hypothetical protein AAB075_07025 [Gemmatimonadota bacterium]
MPDPIRIVLILTVLATVTIGSVIVFRHAGIRRAQQATYAQLKALPPVVMDFTTPEGAILSLEDAYRRRDIEAAVAAKDFSMEAKLMLRSLDRTEVDDALVARTAEVLLASFRTATTAAWPDFEGLQCFLTKREPHADQVVRVTEVCRYPDGGFSEQQILVGPTARGWMVLNLVSP